MVLLQAFKQDGRSTTIALQSISFRERERECVCVGCIYMIMYVYIYSTLGVESAAWKLFAGRFAGRRVKLERRPFRLWVC